MFINKAIRANIILFVLICLPSITWGQENVEMISFGDMDQWITREIKESGIIGGNTKLVYEIGPTQTINGAIAYENLGGSPWGTSNVMAKVAGITKTNTSTFPEIRDNGFCARLDTRMESVKVMGLVDITVLAAGSIFLGSVFEPIKSTKNPNKTLNMGIPFTRKPVAIQYDYKTKMADSKNRIKSTGFGKIGEVEGQDNAATILTLQKRWEDKEGNIYAKRVGTMVIHYNTTTPDWQNNATYEILYGDITGHPSYNSNTMRLNADERFSMNSKGENMIVKEVGWAEPNEDPTHLMLQFTSSHGGAFIGSPGNTFWVDNVKLVY